MKSSKLLMISLALCSASAFADTAMYEKSNSEKMTVSTMLDRTVEPWVPNKGASTLTRKSDRIALNGYATGLKPGHAYSIWWAVYNLPKKCVDGNGHFDEVGCGKDEVENMELAELTKTSLLWAGGTISDVNGNASFSAELVAGNPFGAVMMGPGLLYPMKAEVHFLLRDHGPMILGAVDKQVASFDYGCDVYECREVQGGVHKAPMKVRAEN